MDNKSIRKVITETFFRNLSNELYLDLNNKIYMHAYSTWSYELSNLLWDVKRTEHGIKDIYETK